MRFSRSEPGFLVSAAVHLGLLAFLLVHFSHDEKFADATEAIPVETVTDAQFHEIMQGEKTAKLAEKPQADKVAEPSELKPTPPPPPPQARTEPGGSDAATPDAARSAAAPGAPPPEAKAPPPEPEKQVERDDAETVRPPPRPKKPEKAQQKPAPKPPKRRPEKPARRAPSSTKWPSCCRNPGQAGAKPKRERKPHQAANLDEVAKLLDEKAPEREIHHRPRGQPCRRTGRASRRRRAHVALDGGCARRPAAGAIQAMLELSAADRPTNMSPRSACPSGRTARSPASRCCSIRRRTPLSVVWPKAPCARCGAAIPFAFPPNTSPIMTSGRIGWSASTPKS